MSVKKRHRWVVEPKLYFCHLSDTSPFLLIDDGQAVDWNQKLEYESVVKEELAGNNQ